jgi:hypothetical protein
MCWPAGKHSENGMHHFLETIPAKRRIRLFWFFLFLVILLMVVFNWLGVPLATAAAPNGMISYELAGTPAKSQSILDSWNAHAQLLAAFSLGLDYLFMLVYASALALACLWAGGSLAEHGWPLANISRWLAWGAYLAAALDAVENVALVQQLLAGAGELPARLAQICAALKFGLIFIGLVYVFYALASRLVSRGSGQSSASIH